MEVASVSLFQAVSLGSRWAIEVGGLNAADMASLLKTTLLLDHKKELEESLRKMLEKKKELEESLQKTPVPLGKKKEIEESLRKLLENKKELEESLQKATVLLENKKELGESLRKTTVLVENKKEIESILNTPVWSWPAENKNENNEIASLEVVTSAIPSCVNTVNKSVKYNVEVTESCGRYTLGISTNVTCNNCGSALALVMPILSDLSTLGYKLGKMNIMEVPYNWILEKKQNVSLLEQ